MCILYVTTCRFVCDGIVFLQRVFEENRNAELVDIQHLERRRKKGKVGKQAERLTHAYLWILSYTVYAAVFVGKYIKGGQVIIAIASLSPTNSHPTGA